MKKGLNTQYSGGHARDLPLGFTPTATSPNRKSRRNQGAKETNNRKGLKRVMVVSGYGLRGITKITTRKQYLKDRVIIHRD